MSIPRPPKQTGRAWVELAAVVHFLRLFGYQSTLVLVLSQLRNLEDVADFEYSECFCWNM